MSSPSTPLTRFFEVFQRNTGDETQSDALTQYADTFLAAGPDGARCVPAAAFAPALAKRKQLFDQLGRRSTELISLDETYLDDRYALARTRWKMTFLRAQSDPEQVTVDSTFLIDLRSERILAYLAHQDVFAILRQRGILQD